MRRVLMVLLPVLLALGGLCAWWLRARTPPPDPPKAEADTGLDRQQTEEMMRVIGYVQ